MDGGVFLGRNAASGLFMPTAEILARLEAVGAERALAASFRALFFDEAEGNAETLAEAARSGGRLAALAVLNPAAYDPASERMAALRRAGFAGVALFPSVQGWDLDGYAVRPLLRDAAASGLPVQIGVRTRRDLGLAAERAGAAGGAALLRWMGGGGYAALADLAAIGSDHGKLLLDVSAVTQSGGIEWLAERLGPERLFVAANLPYAYEGCGYFLLKAARLPDEAKRLVGGGNVARLFGAPAPAKAPEPRRWAELARRPKIDTHWHTSGWNIVEPRADMAALPAEFDAYAIRLAVSSSIRALNDDIEAGNGETRELLDRDPRARGLVVVDPLRPEDSLAEIEKYRGDRRFVGAKTIQDFYGLGLDAPGYAPIFERLRRDLREWPVMAHLPGLAAAARRFPELRFVAAHATWRIAEIADLPNVWCDIATSTSLRHETDLMALLEAVGEDRVIFSSDAQLMNPAWTLGKLASLDLPERVLDKIFLRNAPAAFPRLAEAAAA